MLNFQKILVRWFFKFLDLTIYLRSVTPVYELYQWNHKHIEIRDYSEWTAERDKHRNNIWPSNMYFGWSILFMYRVVSGLGITSTLPVFSQSDVARRNRLFNKKHKSNGFYHRVITQNNRAKRPTHLPCAGALQSTIIPYRRKTLKLGTFHTCPYKRYVRYRIHNSIFFSTLELANG